MRRSLLICVGILMVGGALAWASACMRGDKDMQCAGKDMQCGVHGYGMDESGHVIKIYSKVGNQLICPVTGEKFVITDKTTYSEHKGKYYFYCCPDCKAPFEKEPEKYISKMAQEEKKAEEESHEGHAEESHEGHPH